MIFENVPLNKLELIRPKLEKSLLNFYESDDSLSLPRLKSLIEKQKAETLTSLENQPHDSIAFMIIGDMLHGNTTEDVSNIFFFT